MNVTLKGTNLTPGATITYQRTAITITNVVVVDSTTITAKFSISASATPRSRDIWVVTSAGSSNSVSFSVQ